MKYADCISCADQVKQRNCEDCRKDGPDLPSWWTPRTRRPFMVQIHLEEDEDGMVYCTGISTVLREKNLGQAELVELFERLANIVRTQQRVWRVK